MTGRLSPLDRALLRQLAYRGVASVTDLLDLWRPTDRAYRRSRLDAMIRRGLIQPLPAESGARCRQLTLTNAGREVLQ